MVGTITIIMIVLQKVRYKQKNKLHRKMVQFVQAIEQPCIALKLCH